MPLLSQLLRDPRGYLGCAGLRRSGTFSSIVLFIIQGMQGIQTVLMMQIYSIRMYGLSIKTELIKLKMALRWLMSYVDCIFGKKTSSSLAGHRGGALGFAPLDRGIT